jgi:hypothetical protein
MLAPASRYRRIQILGIGLALIGAGLAPWLDADDAPTWFKITSAALFAMGCFGVIRALFPIGRAVIASDNVLIVEGSPFSSINWSDIGYVGIRSIGLVITVQDPEKYLRKLPRWKRALYSPWWGLDGDLLYIQQVTIGVPLSNLFEAMLPYLKRASGETQQNSN